MKHKPDLNEKITLRISVLLKDELNAICAEHDVDEALIARLALETGIALAKEKGFAAMIERRVKGALIRDKRTDDKPFVAGKVGLTLRAEGRNWVLLKGQKVIGKGPLYELRRKAKNLRPEGTAIELLRADGRRELI